MWLYSVSTSISLSIGVGRGRVVRAAATPPANRNPRAPARRSARALSYLTLRFGNVRRLALTIMTSDALQFAPLSSIRSDLAAGSGLHIIR